MTEKEFNKELKKYEKLYDKASLANKLCNEQQKFLAQHCIHPAKYIKDFNWEHDNGYGRQTRMVGKYCAICSAKDLWHDGTRFSHNYKV